MAKSGKKIFCVITGDVIGSSKLDAADRKQLTRTLNRLDQPLAKTGLSLLSREIFRGDSFQLVFAFHENILQGALMLRAIFRGLDLSTSEPLDVRLGIGSGPIEYKAKNQNESDGTAYRHAAEAFEEVSKNNLAQIRIITESQSLNFHLQAICVAWEAIISRWTAAQAKSMQGSLQGLIHQDIAKKLNVTQPTITRSLQSADDKVIQYLLTYCRKLLTDYVPD